MKNILMIIFSCIIFTGCTAFKPIDVNNKEEIRLNTKIEKDDFKNQTIFYLPSFNVPMKKSIYNLGINVKPVVFKSSDSRDYYLTQVLSYYGEWRRYSEAVDEKGKSLPFIKIKNNVESCRSALGCEQSEQVAIKLPKEYIERHASTGFKYKIYAGGGISHEIYITPQILQAMLSFK